MWKMENERGYIVYKDPATGNVSHNHSKLIALMTHLNFEFAFYKFTVYRCALKISTLQKVLFTTHIPFKLVVAVLEKHRLNNSIDESKNVLPTQLSSLIHDIFFAADKMGYFSEIGGFNPQTATNVLCNFIWNVFDPLRNSPISLLEVKETLLLLCNSNSVEEIIKEYFLLAESNRFVSRSRFESILKVLAKILSYIGEGESYGFHVVPDMIEQAFVQCPEQNGLNEYQFNCLWMSTDTRFVIYVNLLALVLRLKETEKLVHNFRCESCLSEKIIGIRFKCQTCKRFSLCLKCFSKGYSDIKHLRSHRMLEVYSNEQPDRWTHFWAKLCTFFFNRRNRVGGADEEAVVEKQEIVKQTVDAVKTEEPKIEEGEDPKSWDGNATELVQINSRIANSTMRSTLKRKKNISISSPPNSSKSLVAQLSSIVDMLHEQKEHLDRMKKTRSQNPENKMVSDFLDQHQLVLLNVIDQLRFLLQNSGTFSFPTSTPNRFSIGSKRESPLLASINGAELNRSYLEANNSDYSIADVSSWFNIKKSSTLGKDERRDTLSIVNEASDTHMTNFRDLLSKVKEILEDSYSDNSALSEATQNLEKVLDNIIQEEEYKRQTYI